FSSRRRHTRFSRDWSSDVCSSDLAETQQLLDTAAEETGASQVKVTLPGGPDIATVSLSSGEAAAKVTDEDEFTAWVRDHYATERSEERRVGKRAERGRRRRMDSTT